MRYTFVGKNTTVTDALKSKITSKIDNLDKLFPESTSITVTLSVIKNDHKVEATVKLPKRVLRAEVTSDDMYASIDGVADKLEKQMIKYKKRLREKTRRDSSFADELKAVALSEDNLEDNEAIKIERTKKFEVKPMDAEEAVLEMELVAHNFFVFRDAKTDEVNVVYKRKDGTYGLIDPQ